MPTWSVECTGAGSLPRQAGWTIWTSEFRLSNLALIRSQQACMQTGLFLSVACRGEHHVLPVAVAVTPRADWHDPRQDIHNRIGQVFHRHLTGPNMPHARVKEKTLPGCALLSHDATSD